MWKEGGREGGRGGLCCCCRCLLELMMTKKDARSNRGHIVERLIKMPVFVCAD